MGRGGVDQIRAKMGIWWGLLLMLHILHEIGFRVSPSARLWNTKGLNLVLWAGSKRRVGGGDCYLAFLRVVPIKNSCGI